MIFSQVPNNREAVMHAKWVDLSAKWNLEFASSYQLYQRLNNPYTLPEYDTRSAHYYNSKYNPTGPNGEFSLINSKHIHYVDYHSNNAKNEASVITPQIDPNNKSRLNPPNDPKSAKVVFLRPSEESLITWDYNILINGKSVGKIQDEYVASYKIPAGENTITLSGALYTFPVLNIKGNSGSTHYICVGREGNGYAGYIGTLEPLATQEGERLYTMLKKNIDYEPLSKKRSSLNSASSSIIKRR